VQKLNLAVQTLLRAWSQATRPVNPPRLLDQAALPWFAELNRSLGDTLDDAAFDARLRRNTALLHELAAEIAERARPSTPAAALADVEALLAEFAAPPGSGELLFAPAA
jgi:hypothetical protein